MQCIRHEKHENIYTFYQILVDEAEIVADHIKKMTRKELLERETQNLPSPANHLPLEQKLSFSQYNGLLSCGTTKIVFSK